MDFQSQLLNYQNKIWLTQSHTFWYNIFNIKINELVNKLQMNELSLVNLPNIDRWKTTLEQYDYSVDFLQEGITRLNKTNSNLLEGYNEKLIHSFKVQRNLPISNIIHDDIFKKTLIGYDNYVSSYYYFNLLYPFVFKFNIDSNNPSNYIKHGFNYEYNFNNNKLIWYKYPLYQLSTQIVRILSGQIKKECYSDINFINSEILYIADFNNYRFNQYIKNHFLIKDDTFVIDTKWIIDEFNEFIHKTIRPGYLVKILNYIFSNFIQDYSFTIIDNKYVKFDNLYNLYSAYTLKLYENLKKYDIVYNKDILSISTIQHQFIDDPLKYVNTVHSSFNDWGNESIELSKQSLNYDNLLSNKELQDIVNSIKISNTQLDNIKINFISDFVNSKSIEITIYQYLSEIAYKFVNSKEFQDKVITVLYPDLKQIVPDYFKLEIKENIYNFINYIYIELVLSLIENNALYLSKLYRDLISKVNLEHNSSLTNFNFYYNFKSPDIEKYREDMLVFNESVIKLFLLDYKLDEFRLIKRFG